jgi:Cu+-exporting ATPase
MMGNSNTAELPKPAHKSKAAAQITYLNVKGMTCVNCARHVAGAARGVSGIRSANVSLERGQATVQWEPGIPADAPRLIAAIHAEGYEASEALPAQQTDSHANWNANLWIGLMGTLPLMAGEWLFHLGMQPWFQWASLLLATAVQLIAGAGFYTGAWRQIKRGQSNMDTLVALGSTTAYGYSLWALLSGQHGHLYFMEAAAIITLISMGHWMEARVSARASTALRQLLDLAPPRAHKLGDDGQEIEMEAAQLAPGDRVLIRPGDRVPLDGEIVEGTTSIDESMLTGESAPVDKAGGSSVYTGTLNLSGRVIARVTATGEETALARVIQAVERAQNSRANIQRLGDRVSSVFVPIVVMIALSAALWWALAPESAASVHHSLAPYLWPAHAPIGEMAAAFIIAAAVLIVSCPCAMGLATPVAIMAGANAAARNGILIRDGVALEKAGIINAVCFDKTGTLTTGKPVLVEKWTAADGTLPLLELAAELADHSQHPISRAIAQAISFPERRIRESKEVHGAGIEGSFFMNGQPLEARLGAVRWLAESGVKLESGHEFIQRWTAQGATVSGFSIANKLQALFAIRDSLKPGSARVVQELKRQNLELFLITGDNRATAVAIAAQLGIDPSQVVAEVRPDQKAGIVKRFQDEGRRIAFVGDGINDAPALRQADLGIAVSRASDIAREAADIVLLNSEIEAVPASIALARATLRTIKQNLFWAFFYNAAAIPLAALGFMSPILCAAAMGFSDLIVIGNALRLRSRRFLHFRP